MEWLGSKYQMQNKCNAKGIQGVYFYFFSLCGFVALAHSIILSLSIATADVLSPPSLIMYT